MPPQLSVVIPAYNAEGFLAETIASLECQTYRAIEIIVVNDGSSDGTGALIERLERDGARHGRLRVQGIHQKNAGPSSARNAGMAAASGEYIGFLDADDRWFPDKAERHVAVMERNKNLGLTFSGWRIIREDGHPTKRITTAPEGPMSLERLLFNNLIGTPSTVVARASVLKAAGGFDTGLKFAEDLDYWLRVAMLQGVTLWSMGIPLIDRRERVGQATKNWRRMHEGWLTVFERIRDRIPERIAPIEIRARALNDRYSAFLAYEAGDYAAARRLTLQAWRAAPFTLLCSRYAYATTLAAVGSLLPPRLHRTLDRRARRYREGYWV